MKRPQSRYVRTDDGVSIGYQVFGDGPYDLMLVDGWLSNVDANWDVPSYADYLAKLGERARVIAFDRRGFGISDRPASVESMSLEKGMDDMRAVLDAVESERPLVVGFEDGCALTVLFAGAYPERALGLVLGAPLVSYWRTDDFPWGFSAEEDRTWTELVTRSWGTTEFWRTNVDMLDEALADEDLEVFARWSRLCASPRAALAIDEVGRQLDVRPLLPQIAVPTLVVMKEGDRGRAHGAAPWVAEQMPNARFEELPGRGHVLGALDTAYFEALDRFVEEIREEEAVFDRVLATVLFTDIVDSTQHAVELGDRGWKDLLQRHHRTVRSVLARYRGVEIDTAGDGFFATFDGPARAVRAAQQIGTALRPLGLEVRAGVHTGEVQMIDGKAAGLGVVIGARIGAMAGPSEVLASQTVKDLVAGSGLVFEDRGVRQLKGVPDEWRVYAAVG
jgi:class 3 adenylate cyclase